MKSRIPRSCVRAIDELLDRADVTIDPAARFKILGEAETVLTKEQLIVPIWRMNRNYLLHPAVHGFIPNLLDLHPYQHLWLE